MAKGLNRLTAREVANTTERGRYADGGGLYLSIDGRGVRQWAFRFQIDGKRQEMMLGGVNAVSLADARRVAAECRTHLANGRNPLELRRAEREAALEARRAESGREARTFAAVRDAMLASREAGWRNAKHRGQWRSTLEAYASSLDSMDVAEIRTEHVLACLQPIWSTVPETASRVRGRIEAVLNAARARGLTPDDRANPARWRGHLDHLLPKRPKLARGHQPALPWRDVPAFMAELRERDARAARLLEFAILTAARSGEARGATWDEIDFTQGIWIVPAERMKAGVEHRVPLSRRALALLAEAGPPVAGKPIFPAPRGSRFSDMAFLMLLRRMGRGDLTAHGFRSSFRDWAGDATNFPREVIEAALAHSVGNKVEAAYRRGDALEKRRALMEAWATYCEPKAQNVVSLTRKA